MLVAIVFIMAFLLGSLPFAVWLGKIFYGVDVRHHGSRNSGATNTFRVLGKPLGFTVLFLDIFKGFLAIQLTISLLSTSTSIGLFSILTGLFCILGHVYSIFLKFKGGKGVATSLGVFIALDPIPVLVSFAVFLLILSVTRYVSLASIAAATLLPVISYVAFHQIELTQIAFKIFIAILVLVTHRKNIKRLLRRSEPKMNLSKPNA